MTVPKVVATRIVQVAVESLKQHPKNARTHDIDKLRSLIRLHGFTTAIGVQRSKHVVVYGNGRLEAAIAEGMGKVPVVWLDLTDGEAEEILAADNAASDAAGYDNTKLVALLAGIEKSGRLAFAGFVPPDLSRLRREVERAAEDPTASADTDPGKLPARPVTRPGDLWEIGPHRVFCGDATDNTYLDVLLGGHMADLVFTDPPYGVDYGAKNRHLQKHGESPGRLLEDIENDGQDLDALERLLADSFTIAASACRPGAVWFVTAPAGPSLGAFCAAIGPLGIWRGGICWLKNQMVFGRSDYHYRFEYIFYGWTPGAAHTGPPDRKDDSVWEISRPRASPLHPTMKPVELIERAISNHTSHGDVVLDPFAGSGSALIAAQNLGRIARCVELAPAYVDVIVRRACDHMAVTPSLNGKPAKVPGSPKTTK